MPTFVRFQCSAHSLSNTHVRRQCALQSPDITITWHWPCGLPSAANHLAARRRCLLATFHNRTNSFHLIRFCDDLLCGDYGFLARFLLAPRQLQDSSLHTKEYISVRPRSSTDIRKSDRILVTGAHLPSYAKQPKGCYTPN